MSTVIETDQTTSCDSAAYFYVDGFLRVIQSLSRQEYDQKKIEQRLSQFGINNHFPFASTKELGGYPEKLINPDWFHRLDSEIMRQYVSDLPDTTLENINSTLFIVRAGFPVIDLGHYMIVDLEHTQKEISPRALKEADRIASLDPNLVVYMNGFGAGHSILTNHINVVDLRRFPIARRKLEKIYPINELATKYKQLLNQRRLVSISLLGNGIGGIIEHDIGINLNEFQSQSEHIFPVNVSAITSEQRKELEKYILMGPGGLEASLSNFLMNRNHIPGINITVNKHLEYYNNLFRSVVL